MFFLAFVWTCAAACRSDSLMCGRGWCCQQWQETELVAKKASD